MKEGFCFGASPDCSSVAGASSSVYLRSGKLTRSYSGGGTILVFASEKALVLTLLELHRVGSSTSRTVTLAPSSRSSEDVHCLAGNREFLCVKACPSRALETILYPDPPLLAFWQEARTGGSKCGIGGLVFHCPPLVSKFII